MNLLEKLRFTDRGIIFSIRRKVVGTGLGRRLANWILYRPGMDDRSYLIKKYKETFGVTPDLDSPKNFNEKNNWRKLYDRNPLYTRMVDKYQAKLLVEERVGDGHTFPLLGVWDNPEDIRLDLLPDKFVLKVNHAGGIIVCKDKKTFNFTEAIDELKQQMSTDYYIRFREWAYKDVRRKVICEQYMGENLTDYKNYCFNGKLMYTFVWENLSREDGRKPQATFCGAYDRDWNLVDIELGYPSSNKVIKKPDSYSEMVSIAEKMAEGTPFVRVDCYNIGGKAYVGEMTMYPWAGLMRFKDENWNNKFGEFEKLPYEE